MKPIKYSQDHSITPLSGEDLSVALSGHQNVLNDTLKEIKRDYGIFFTPEGIVDLMIGLIDWERLKKIKDPLILEPACGLAQFLMGIKRNQPELFNRAGLFGVEINQELINYLKNLNLARNLELVKADYLLWQPGRTFDLVIGNPPYGIPGFSEHYPIKVDHPTKQKYKDNFETWYGKYNLYGAFIEKSIQLLETDGQLLLIIPATFMILDDFKKLRKFLAQNGKTSIIYLGPDVFKPEAEVASSVLNFRKSAGSKPALQLLEYQDSRFQLIVENNRWQGEVIRFETDYTRKLEKTCSHLLNDLYEIRISPRTPEIKHSSLVIREKPLNKNGYLPILNGRNLRCKEIIYENRTGYWIKKSEADKLRAYFQVPHLVVGLGFRENGKVAAAYDDQAYPWMGDVYHLFKKDDLFTAKFDLGQSELLEYLNSDYLKRYIKEVYREITYHLSITQLKNIPVPGKKEWKKISNGAIE